MEAQTRAYPTPRAKERADKHQLRIEKCEWQKAAIGLLGLSVAFNMALAVQINRLEVSRQEDAKRYTAQIESAEQIQDMAVQQLGAAVLQNQREAQARAEQTAAYEALGAYRYIGKCTITYYCPCEECCGRWADGFTATGIPAAPGVVAVDKSVIPLGSTVVIDGVRYLAADTGVTGNHVDICVSSHEAAETFGVGAADVWVVADKAGWEEMNE